MRVKKKLLGAIVLATLPLAAAQAMDVATFLTKADALEKKGMMALFSSDYKMLKREIETQSQVLRNERLAAERAHRRPAYCPPAKPGLNSNEILASFRTIPAAQRPRTQVKDALRALLARKYPCRG
jgi:small neutral amino acid transporter SnatA (MarC family)